MVGLILISIGFDWVLFVVFECVDWMLMFMIGGIYLLVGVFVVVLIVWYVIIVVKFI